jgi:outer membrane protein, heavy metal efflux system
MDAAEEDAMRTGLTGFLLLMALTLPARSWADDNAVTLKELERETLRNNPEIRMVEKRAESADEKRSLASAMPDPMIGYMVQNEGSPFQWTVGGQQTPMSMQGVVFSQEIPFPGKLSTMGRVAAMRAEREHESARETKYRILSNLRSAYYEYYLAYRSSDILNETKDLMKSFQLIAETRYGTGQGMQQDVLRAQLEVSMLLDKLAEEERKKESQAAVINSLTGRDPMAPLGRPAELPVVTLTKSIDELAAMVNAHSPALLGKERMVEQGEFEVSSSKKEFLPDMVVSGGWFFRGQLPDVWSASLMFKVPLYFWNKSTGVRAANAELSSSRYDLEAARLMVKARVRDLYAFAKTSEHHLHLYETGIIPQARMALQSATSNYRVGKTDFLGLLDSQSLLLKYQLMQQEELVNLHRTLAMIGEMTGEENEK